MGKQINITTLSSDIDNTFNNAVIQLGYDPNSPADRKAITQNEITAALRQVYYILFQPEHNLPNNQKSLIDYSDLTMLSLLADKFNNICLLYNKSMGLFAFSMFTGISYNTLKAWRDGTFETVNPERMQLIKNIAENNRCLQVALLNNTPVGALAVANNDTETGLKWSANQAAQITNNTVYYIPSERAGRLQLDKAPDQ